jgi:hypothetical protein
MKLEISKLEYAAYFFLFCFFIAGCFGYDIIALGCITAMVVLIAIDSYLFNQELKKLSRHE